MQEVVIATDCSISDNVFDSQTIKSKFLTSLNTNSNNIVAGISGLLSSVHNLNEIIDPAKVYVAQFPKAIIEKMKSGQYELWHTKSGEILSNIIDKTLPANKNIIHNIRLAEMDPSLISKVQNLSSNLMNVALQQQLIQISEELSQIKMIAASIRTGQILDRIALVHSGKRQLENAIEATSKSKSALMYNAIQSLETGRTQLEFFLIDELQKIKGIPSSKYKFFLKCLFDNKFYNRSESTYNDFQKCFRVFIDASIYLSMAYNEIKNEKAMQNVFEPTNVLIRQSSQKMLMLSHLVIKGGLNEDFVWYKNPELIIENINNYTNKTMLKSAEVISVEINGYKLLELKGWMK